MKRFLNCCAFVIWAVPALAQTTSTEVLGTVTDGSGAVVPNTKLTLLRVATGERRQAVTNSDGNYSFPFIEIGEFTVTAEMPGFKTQTKTGINVELQQKARVNFLLDVGQASEKVEVVAAGVELKTDDASVGTTVEQKRVLELPLLGRNFASLAVLTPGVQYGTRMGLNGQSTGAFPFPGAAAALSANGQRDANQRITMDGVVATEPLVNQAMFNPSIDAVEEIKVSTGSYSAEYGHNNGAVVQIALKSGTNRFRGTVFNFLRNDVLDARDYFLNFQTPAGTPERKKNALRRNQFGLWMAGPVLLPKIYNGKDRTFWSFNYEGVREMQESVQEGFFAPEAFRRGDFSALLTPLIRDGRPVRSPTIIYDPMTGEPFRDADGRINNIIPASRINANAQRILNTYLPLPQFEPADLLDVNTRRGVPMVLGQNQYFARVDHNFSGSDRIFVRYALQRSQYDRDSFNPNFPTIFHVRAHNVAFQHLHIFSPRTLNEFRAGFNKTNHDQLNRRTYTDFDPDSLGVGQFRVATDSNRKFSALETGIPNLGVIPGDAGARIDLNGIYQFSDNLSLTRGNHTFKTGIEYLRYGLDRAAANVPLGSLTCCEGGYGLAGWLMGYPSASSTAEGLLWTAPRQNRWGAYFLDEWKVTRKFTANIGLRWDFFQVPHDVNRTWRTLRLDVLSRATDGRQLPTVVPGPGEDYSFFETDNRYFMPRIGLAYRATDKWVFRTGFGWFANAQQLNNFTILNLQPPKSGTFGFNQVTDTALVIPVAYGGQNYNIQTRRFRNPAQALTLNNPFPGQGTAAARTNLLMFPRENKASSVVQWSFDIQRSLPWNTLLTVGYVGSKTSHLDNSVPNFNNPDPSTDTDFQSRRPYQAYVSQGEGDAARLMGNIRFLDSYANGSYHGLQTQVQKRYSSGVTIGLSYVYSKALGEGYGRNDPSGDVNATYQNPRNRRADRTRYGFDVTHNAVLNYVYDLPFFKSLKGPAGALLAGWQSSGIVTIRTGFPYSLAGGNLNTGSGTYPDRIGDGRLPADQRSRQLWFDPTAFRRTDCNIPNRADLCHYGNAGNGILVSPGGNEWNLSLGKNWVIQERYRLQFRAEAFNAFNTPQFGRPNGLGWATLDSIVPDAPRVGEIRALRSPMRIFQMGLKIYF